MTEQTSDKQLTDILKGMSDPSNSKLNLEQEIEKWDKDFYKSSNREIGGGLVFAVFGSVVAVYVLHLLYQVKTKCSDVEKTPLVIAEVLLWIQIVVCALLTLGSIYALLFT